MVFMAPRRHTNRHHRLHAPRHHQSPDLTSSWYREAVALREEIEFGLSMSSAEMLTIRRDLLERILAALSDPVGMRS